MKITQSIVVASLSVAAHSSVASPVRDFSPQNFLSPRAAKVALGGATGPRMDSRRRGRRAPSLPVALAPQADLPDNDNIQPESLTPNSLDSATGAAGGLRTVSGPLSGPVGGAVSELLGSAADTLHGAPAVGDLTKALPLDSLSQGDPLNSTLGLASSTASGLPVAGGPLADTLNSTATLTQALPLSLAVMPDSRALVLPTYPLHQLPVAAHELTMAGGAFPIQPSRSLDGLTLPNEPIGPGSLHSQGHAEHIGSDDDTPKDTHVATQQEPAEDTQVKADRYPEEDDQVPNSANDGQVHSQELPQEQDRDDPFAPIDNSSKFPSALPGNGYIPPAGFVPDFLTSAFDHTPSPALELSYPKNYSPFIEESQAEVPLENRKLSSQHLKKWWKAKSSSIARKFSQQR